MVVLSRAHAAKKKLISDYGELRMHFPLTFRGIGLWLTVTAIILLATVELISPHYRRTNVIIEKARPRKMALIVAYYQLSWLWYAFTRF